MKKLIISLLLISLLPFMTEAKSLRALFSYKSFYSPESGSYLEAYLSVHGGSVVFKKNENGLFTGSIEVSYTFSSARGIVHSDKYNLISQEVSDTSNVTFNFLDQQRIQLANGIYTLELRIKDNHDDNAKPYSVKQEVNLEYYNNIAAISDIELVESFEVSDDVNSPLYKNGYKVVPFANNFYPATMDKVRFYAEIYNTAKVLGDEAYLLVYYIRNNSTKTILKEYRAFKKQQPRAVNVLIAEFPIVSLPSGNYDLVVEIRNQKNEYVASQEVFFQRSNTISAPTAIGISDRNINNTFAAHITGRDTLKDLISSLRPIADPLENTFITNQLNLADTKLMQQFLYDFWVKRNPIDPETAFREYNTEVMKVNRSFGTRITRGYDTERGRVYLQYGPPNTMSKNYNEPSAYPYEIWHYYKLNQQTNRRFVFYNPDLVSDEFILLHSDAQGEIYDTQWENKLHKRDSQTRDIDQEGLNNDDYFGNQASDIFDNPR